MKKENATQSLTEIVSLLFHAHGYTRSNTYGFSTRYILIPEINMGLCFEYGSVRSEYPGGSDDYGFKVYKPMRKSFEFHGNKYDLDDILKKVGAERISDPAKATMCEEHIRVESQKMNYPSAIIDILNYKDFIKALKSNPKKTWELVDDKDLEKNLDKLREEFFNWTLRDMQNFCADLSIL